MGIWCHIEVRHISDMFHSLGYNNVANINRLLRDIKYEISTNYIYSDNKGVVITTNKIATSSNLNIVEKYMKELKITLTQWAQSFYNTSHTSKL